MPIDLSKYYDFVAAVTSEPSNDLTTFMNRLDEIDQSGVDVNVPLLITACMGLAAEAGEFVEIPKKILFQGKPITEAEVFHLKRELGDVMWYWINACRALNLNPDDVIAENVNKLQARYPGGDFDPFYSENRQAGDL